MNNYQAYADRERGYMNRAMQLAQHVGFAHPMQNMAPLLDLIRRADAFGLDLVPRSPGMQQQAALGGATVQSTEVRDGKV